MTTPAADVRPRPDSYGGLVLGRHRKLLTALATVAVIALVLNVGLRVLPLEDIDLPSLGLPDLPGWLKWVKNGVILLLIALAVVGAVQEDGGRRE